MTDTCSEPRRFSVHARHVDRHHARIVSEASFEAAAIAYAEDLHGLPEGGGEEVSVIVRDLQSGHEHAFRLHVAADDSPACE